MNTLIISNLVFAFFLKLSLNTLFSAINSFQITAHMPLLEIPFSPKAYFVFDFLIKIVAFDIIEVHELVDLKLRPSEPWSWRFDWLGYGSSNFVENLGAILVIIFIMILEGTIVLLLQCCRCSKRIKACAPIEKVFGTCLDFQGTVIRFFMETFFELLICTMVGFKLNEIRQTWSLREDFVTVFQIVTLVMLVFFICLVTYYTFRVLPKLVKQEKDKDAKARKDLEISRLKEIGGPDPE